jgi:hypothetical protein
VLRDPVTFWQRMAALPTLRQAPERATVLLRRELRGAAPPRFIVRRAGLGSLGHPRVVAVAEHAGGLVAREAKALVGSAASWAADPSTVPKVRYAEIVDGAVRCADPFLDVRDKWVIRRLAPDCSRIEFTVATHENQPKLLHSMGFETANVHLGSGKRRVAAVKDDLANRRRDWLKLASQVMERATLADHAAWQRAQNG